MEIPMVDLLEELEIYGDSVKSSLIDVIESGSYILGNKGSQFEKQVADYLKVNYAIGVANGTDALLLALKTIGIKPGDEVITTPFTFFATGEVIASVGATPVFVDIDPKTYNIDTNLIEDAITEKTKAIIVVHLFGKTVDMKTIMNIAEKYELKVIEDACQSIGSEYQGKKTGSIGDIGCFSFFPSKSLGAFGDAGMVVTNNQSYNEKLIKLRNHGSEARYKHSDIGVNSRLDEMQAAILLEKFKFLELFLERRNMIANYYTRELNTLVRTPEIIESKDHTFHQYCIETEQRDKLSTFLNKKGISTAIYYPIPLHLQKAFNYLNYQEKSFPITENVCKKIVALPIYPTLSLEKQQYIISAIKEFAGGAK